MRTPAVRLGVVRSLQGSLIVPLTGMAILSAALLVMYLERSHELASFHPTGEVVLVWGLSLLVLVAGYYLPIARTWQMLQVCRHQPPGECVPKLPAFCHYAAWQASSVLGVAAASAVFFVVTNYLWR